MTILSPQQLKELIAQPAETCVSIYLPAHRAGAEIRQDPIRFKNLLSEAMAGLNARGWRSSDAEELLKSAQELDRPDFWQHQDRGLAVFVAPNFCRYYRLPLNFEELVVVSDRFHLKPLIPIVSNNGRFYILALSQNQVKLFQGSYDQITEVTLNNDVPSSLAEALKYDDPEKQLQAHTGNPSNVSGKSSIFHGHGVGTGGEYNQNQIWRFFQKVDRGLHSILNQEQAPLVLAAVEYLQPIYQDVNSYPYLLETGVVGNPDHLSAKELHQQAWQVVKPHFEQQQQQAEAQYRELAGAATGKASNDLQEIIKAAYYQKIDSLFIALGTHKWGRFEPETETVQIHQQPEPNDEDLLDFAAIHTFLNGGSVYATSPDNLPENVPIAATFRY